MNASLRDRIVHDWQSIVDGRARTEQSDRVREVIWRWDDHHLVHLRWLIPQIVDAVLREVGETGTTSVQEASLNKVEPGARGNPIA